LLLGQEDAVLDRADAGADGVLEPLAAEGVRHYALAPPRRLEHGDADLLLGQLRDVAVVVRREHAARRAELDPVAAAPQHPPLGPGPRPGGAGPPRVGGPGEGVGRPAGEVGDVAGRPLAARAGQVAAGVTAGLAERDDRHLQPRPGHVAGRDRVADAGVRPAR